MNNTLKQQPYANACQDLFESGLLVENVLKDTHIKLLPRAASLYVVKTRFIIFFQESVNAAKDSS